MNAAAGGPQDPLLPQPPGGNGLGAAMAVGVHLGLLFALAAATHWRTHSPTVVAAELWSSVPEVAAPVAPPPPPPAPAAAPAPAPVPPPPAVVEPPPPPKVDIAVEEAKRAERERRAAEAEAERKAKAEAERKAREEAERKAKTERKAKLEAERKRRQEERRMAAEAAAQQARLAQAREETLRRLMTEAGAAANPDAVAAGRGSAARNAAPSAEYTARLAALIRSHTVFTGEVPGNPAAEVEVRAGASGSIIARKLVKSSGHAAWDEAVLRAIDRVGTLPRDSDGRVPRTLIIAFRPKE